MTLALQGSDKPAGWLTTVPAKSPLKRGEWDTTMFPVSIHRSHNVTTYAVNLPWQALSLSQPASSVFRLGVLVNDNDGKGRKGWLQSPATFIAGSSVPSTIVDIPADTYPR